VIGSSGNYRIGDRRLRGRFAVAALIQLPAALFVWLRACGLTLTLVSYRRILEIRLQHRLRFRPADCGWLLLQLQNPDFKIKWRFVPRFALAGEVLFTIA